MVTRLPIILLKPKRKRSRALRILTSPKTTLALTGILAAFAFPAAAGRLALGLVPKTPTGIAKLAFVAGAVSAVPSLVTTFNPFRAGKKAAPFIADPSKLLPTGKQPLREKIKETAIQAGLITAGVAAIAGVAAAARKKIKGIKIPKVSEVQPGALPAPIIQPSLVEPVAPAALQAFGAAQPTPTKEPVAPPAIAAVPAISNKITFNPEINIRFSKSRKFINQQLLIR